MTRHFFMRCVLLGSLVAIAGNVELPHLYGQIDNFWKNPNGGSFFDTGNWIFGVVPPAQDGAVFNLRDQLGIVDANYTVTFNSDHTNAVIEVSNDEVTLDLGGNTYELTRLVFGQPRGEVQVGFDTNFGGGGALTTMNGTLLSEFGILGVFGGTTGLMTVDGPGATWASSILVHVGSLGTGHLTVSNGANVSAAVSEVGSGIGATGMVTVDGANSSWTHSAHLFLGVLGNSSGTLMVSDGGAVSNLGVAKLGQDATAIGTATVDGSGSSWTGTGFFTAGDFGEGNLTISDGGTVTILDQVYVAYSPGSSGSILVDGGGSTMSGQNISIGGSEFGPGGSGQLTVQNGAAISTGGTLNVWGTGQIDLVDGTITADTLNLAPGGLFNFTGGTVVANSVLGNLDNQGGTLSPGNSPGVTTIQGNYTQQAGATLAIEVAGDGDVPGTDFDQLQVTGTATMEGTVTVDVLDSFTPTSDITIVTTTGGITLPGIGLTLGGPDAALFSGISVMDNDLVLTVLTDGLTGDYNGDGVVDGADFLKWQQGLGTIYDATDLADWEANYGMVAPLSATVPEPTSLALLSLGGLLALRSFRRATAFTT